MPRRRTTFTETLGPAPQYAAEPLASCGTCHAALPPFTSAPDGRRIHGANGCLIDQFLRSAPTSADDLRQQRSEPRPPGAR